MASFNKTIIAGNLCRDVELKFTPGGTAVAEVSLAVNEVRYDKDHKKIEEVSFVDVTLWGKTAEVAGEYLRKGSNVLIEGKLKSDSWDDKETGKKRSKLKVVAERLVMLGGKNNNGDKSDDRELVGSGVDSQSSGGGDAGGDIPF